MSGEAYAWQPAVRTRGPGGGADPRRLEAQSALDRAAALQAAGRYPDAVALGEHALRLLEAAPRSERRELARCLVWLGEIQWLAGDLARAELLLKRGLAILEMALGTSHLEVAATRNKLAIVYQAQGLCGRAEPLHLRALAMQEAVLGPNHLDVATSVNNLAILYKGQGLYRRAEPLYERAVAIREAALGPNHPDVAASLGNLAGLYAVEGLHLRAETLLRRALAIQERKLGPNHPDVAASLSDLAAVYKAQRRYRQAESLARRALAIRRASLGEGHPSVASSLHELAGLCFAQGLLDQADVLTQQALTIRRKALGEHHPNVEASLEIMAQLHLAQRKLDETLPLLWQSLALSEERLRREALDFSESRLASYLGLLHAGEERHYALLRAYPEDTRVQHLALTVALLRKGRTIEEIASTSRTLYRSLEFLDRDAFERLRGLRSQLARLSLDGPGARSAAEYQRQMKELADQGDALETKLARRSARLRALAPLATPADIVDRVAAALPEDGVLVEIVAYVDRPLTPMPDMRVPEQLRYAAFVLSPGARIRAVDLGPGTAIEGAVSRLRAALASRAAGFQEYARELHALVFEPLRPLVGNARRIFLAPDGELALVPFAALHDGSRFLMDAFEITYLTSGKDLLSRPAESPRSRSVVVLADPDFAADPARPGPRPADLWTAAERDHSLAEARRSRGRDRSGGQWVPLPGTRLEAEAIQRLYPQAQVFLGPEASKDRLLEVDAPGVLHVATHGFFLEDPAAPAGARGVGFLDVPTSGGLKAYSSNPLLRSGLVLAGALVPEGSAEAMQARLDRTLVTALELAGVDLWKTQLVVLSACDTGRGDFKLGQGIYGLRRALVSAGAETVVMSLWTVNDEATHTLMEHYYRQLLAGQGRTAALQSAMQSLRATHPHPYYWAPFISLGRDAPISFEDEERGEP